MYKETTLNCKYKTFYVSRGLSNTITLLQHYFFLTFDILIYIFVFVVTVLAFVREGNNENPLENCAVGNLHEVRSDFGGFSLP